MCFWRAGLGSGALASMQAALKVNVLGAVSAVVVG